MSQCATQSFEAVLERDGTRLNWVIVRLPLDVKKVWGMRGTVKVKGTINGFAFRSTLFPTGKGGHIMIVNKRMQKGAAVRVGAMARFGLEPDTEERIVTTPAELKRMLAEDKALLRWYDKLNYSTRKAIRDWIEDVRSPEARVRRSEQMAVRLLETMQAEQELPPMLRLAFERNARARGGWEKMSLARRRGHLLGIFYYRTPEGRARRLAKAIEDAVHMAERKKK
ncbi:MAG TPA: YdeI/OmpD-associated family protein [Terriglobales bacterium]|nr:YdeI/OmpD-associated family protein [Terriglobales bacterium]